MKKIISYIGMLLPALMLLVGCTDIDDFALAPRELTLSATMPTDNVFTRVGLETQYNSLNMSAKWKEADEVQIIITQGNQKYEIGKVRVSNITDENTSAEITIKLPEELDIEQRYSIFAFTGIEGKVVKGDEGAWQPSCTAEIKRTWLRFFTDIPLYCRVNVSGNELPTMRFQHFGTYELLHVTNATSALISFRQDGFESEYGKWYWKRANINPDNGAITSGVSGESENNKGQNLHAGETDDFISWYLPTGKKLNKAYLKATINNQQVKSTNSKSSDVNIKCGRVYHLYATWNGQKLTFDNGDFVESKTYTLSKDVIDYTKVKAGNTYTDYFIIKNTGNVPLTCVLEATHGEFEIEKSGQPIQLADNGGSEVVVVKFSPEQYNHTYQKTVRITCEGAEGPKSIVLKGQTEAKTGVTRTYTVTPETVEFGPTIVGNTYNNTFAIKNTGDAALQFFIEATHGEFEIAQSGKMFEVKPNATEPITVIFKPQNYNTTYQKEVAIFCYDAQGPKKIILKAQTRPQETKTYTVTPEEINFGTTDVGETKERTFVIKNTGNVSMSFHIASTHGEFEIGQSGQAFQLTPTEAKPITVKFTPETFDKDYEKEVRIQCSVSDAVGPKSITLKGHTETRIDQVIPPDIREKLEEHITIYDGVNPPNVEGEYVIKPCELSYDSGFNIEPGYVFADCFIKFYNQDSHKNTIDYQEKQSSSETVGEGAFISGEGNNFSIFFNTKGISYFDDYNVYTKEALVISGTKTADGIKNLEYAFIMVDKSDDSQSFIMPVGDFRAIKDGDDLAELTTWSSAVKAMRARAMQRSGKTLSGIRDAKAK